MISRILLALAAVAASVGLILYGMGTSYSPQDDGLKNVGLIMLIAGAIGVVIGIVWYRATESTLVAEARARYGDERMVPQDPRRNTPGH